MNDIQFKRLEWEQQAYSQIREHMVQEFLVDPPGFLKRVGCRPEYMTPEQLRGMYRNMVVQGAQVSGEPGFVQRFQEGRMFS